MASGAPRWGTWISPGIDDLLASLAIDAGRQTANETLERVTIAMEKPASSPEIKAAAHDASGSLVKCLTSVARTGLTR